MLNWAWWATSNAGHLLSFVRYFLHTLLFFVLLSFALHESNKVFTFYLIIVVRTHVIFIFIFLGSLFSYIFSICYSVFLLVYFNFLFFSQRRCHAIITRCNNWSRVALVLRAKTHARLTLCMSSSPIVCNLFIYTKKIM